MHRLRVLDTDTVPELIRALRAALDGSGPAVLPLGPDQTADGMGLDEPVEPDTALVVRTSGSTGTPKGVLLSASALRASATATHERLGGPGVWLLAMPTYHIAGIQVLVRSILAGTEPVVLQAKNFRPRAFVEAASDALGSIGPVYTSLVPTQLTRIVNDGGDALAALRSFDAVLVGGAAVSPEIMERSGARIVTTYGMSETAGGCVYAGAPLSGVGVRVVDGVISLRGPMLAHGYRLDPAGTAESFVDGWFRTSDTGTLEGGALRVLGRLDDVINTGGVKVVAAAVERVLTAQPRVTDACVLGLPDPEWGQRVAAAVAVGSDGWANAESLRAAVREALGPAAVPKVIAVVDELPLTGPGKVDRLAVERLFPA
ncbi:O-succinylbenzoic acid--CoA ligase [Alloactinosynnema sp. L-07]|uniref:o-succinylbenzoate--CoA ligase n=1 Tax=Alloactinosynnema sp. L-07 TaxID=1653480 RepID=UPI00065F02CA|nr:o-succinylbenzoate--CoA ligase [Alloactinosynnema sp. L-07]CRK60156.1 O-succinylbenzoic acid--CoA ligase [Alloactinosynnema sp. L-07]